MNTFLKFLFVGIFITMLSVTLWAGSHQNIFQATQVWTDPWSRATLFDAYGGFTTFYVWVAYKERPFLSKIIWFVLIMALGNIAMSTYMLIQLFKLKSGESLEKILFSTD